MRGKWSVAGSRPCACVGARTSVTVAHGLGRGRARRPARAGGSQKNIQKVLVRVCESECQCGCGAPPTAERRRSPAPPARSIEHATPGQGAGAGPAGAPARTKAQRAKCRGLSTASVICVHLSSQMYLYTVLLRVTVSTDRTATDHCCVLTLNDCALSVCSLYRACNGYGLLLMNESPASQPSTRGSIHASRSPRVPTEGSSGTPDRRDRMRRCWRVPFGAIA